MNEQLLPLLEKVRGLVDENTPKIQTVITNVTETSDLVKSQAVKIDGAVTETGLARSQAGTPGWPPHHGARGACHGLQHAVSAGAAYVGAGGRRSGGIRRISSGAKARRAKAAPTDEMFI